MPMQLKSSVVPYDLASWRKRCDLTQEQAAQWLGVSTSKLWRIERDRLASLETQWACYGLERFIQDKREGKIP